MQIKEIFVTKFSSNYGESNSSFGQPLGVKSIVIVSVKSNCGNIRSHELYLGIYIPEIIETLVDYISPLYLNKKIDETLILEEITIPFTFNSGIFKSIKGAIDSCILQLIFFSTGITLVDGLKKLLRPGIRRDLTTQKINFYASGGSVSYSKEKCVEDVLLAIKNNFDGFKMRCGYKDFEDDILRVGAVHSHIKENFFSEDFLLMIDFIQGTLQPKFSNKDLENYVSELESFNIYWFEEPLNPDNIILYKKATQGILKKSCLGESFTGLNEYIAFENLINRFQIDVTHIGGFIEATKVLNYFNEFHHSTKFTSHVWGSKLSLLLNLALCRASSSIEWFEIPILEFEVNNHLFDSYDFNYKQITDQEIDMLISEINLDEISKYEFKPGSGYRIS